MIREINRCGADARVPCRTPWSGSSNTAKTEADGGVGRGPGGRPHIADFSNKLQGRETSLPACPEVVAFRASVLEMSPGKARA